MNNYSADKYDSLLSGLTQGLKLSEKYRELTLLQRDAISADDEKQLLALLGERSLIIDEIDDLTRALEPEMAEYRGLYNPPDGRAAEILDKSRALLEECAEIDKVNLENIRNLMQKTATNGKNIAKRRESISKYAGSDLIAPPEYLDELH